MNIIRTHHSEDFRRLDTKGLRDGFLVTGLMTAGRIEAAYWEQDRTVIGGAVPLAEPLALPAYPELASETFCERRELGIVNLGETGSVATAEGEHRLGRFDVLYLGRGVCDIRFVSEDPAKPAAFYFVSLPAHAAHPSKLIPFDGVEPLRLGSTETSNKRTLHKMIAPGTADSCQLVMGITFLKDGSVWNTMPPHTHERRSEVYFYFDVPEEGMILHLVGKPEETRHLIVRNHEAALSPNWSIHSGAGTGSYGFVWAMGGENQNFADMDSVPWSRLH